MRYNLAGTKSLLLKGLNWLQHVHCQLTGLVVVDYFPAKPGLKIDNFSGLDGD